SAVKIRHSRTHHDVLSPSPEWAVHWVQRFFVRNVPSHCRRGHCIFGHADFWKFCHRKVASTEGRTTDSRSFGSPPPRRTTKREARNTYYGRRAGDWRRGYFEHSLGSTR